MSSLEPGSSRARQQPEETNERRLTGWQRAVRWVLWLTFLGVAVWKSLFCRENGARLKSKLSAEFFTGMLSVRGFEVDATTGNSFTARRK